MSKAWPWIFGIGISLFIIMVIANVRSDRHSYWAARRSVYQPVVVVQVPSDLVLKWRLHHYYQR